MADNIDEDQDVLGENWLSSWESQCLEGMTNELNMDGKVLHENELASQQLWLSFQNSASAIAQLHSEGCHQSVSLWVPFQNAASRVVQLYKDSLDVQKKSYELGNQYGFHRRNKDLLNWVKKRRRHIRREDLLAFLCGRQAPMRNHHHHRTTGLNRTPSRVSVVDGSPRRSSTAEGNDDTEPDLEPFKDALALQGLSGAMSNISVGRQASPSNAEPAPNGDNFHRFILDEMTRRCEAHKRSAASAFRLDSPSRKRSRTCCKDDSTYNDRH